MPDNGSLHGGLGMGCGFGQGESQAKNTTLLIGIVGWSHRIAEGQVGEHESRYGVLLDDVASASDDHGRQTVGFEVSCGQTDRLMAYRSKRNEQHQVDVVFERPDPNILGPGQGAPLGVDGRHAVVAGAH